MDKQKFLEHIKYHEVTSCSDLANFTNLTVKTHDDILILLNALQQKVQHGSKELNDIPLQRNELLHCIQVMDDVVVSIGQAAMAEGFHAYKDI